MLSFRMKTIITAEELLDVLVKEYPEMLPRKEVSSYDMGKLVGIQGVIDHIRLLLK